MNRPTVTVPFICARCLRAQRAFWQPKPPYRLFATPSAGANEATARKDDATDEELGAMSRRLSDMSDRSLEEGGSSAQKAVEEAGFNEELKDKLLERIANAKFRSENAGAFAQASTPSHAGQGTRDIAGARVWTGHESLEDAALRMLNDASKPMRLPSKIPDPRGAPIKVETGRKRSVPVGARLANARDRVSTYSYLKDDSVSQKEREHMRKELKERFTPGARSVPATLQGLASLANERIEDAIARGQFKNLPRGKKIERDYNMSSPFLDTTEYFMNKIIQKQDIVPPWIEKQQEVTSTATKFRARLRADWRRHAARLISSQGGSLESQIRKAEQYAAAEAIVNPSKKKQETINTIDSGGHVSQITLAGELKEAEPGSSEPASKTITITENTPPVAIEALPEEKPHENPASSTTPFPPSKNQTTDTEDNSNPYDYHGTIFPFRDLSWERTELSYHTLAITNLNSLTRSYNLMAPNLAKKPYFNLTRELRSCFADVAPQLADEIRERASRPRVKIEVVGHKEGGVLERFAGAEKARVWDERRPKYGFKEFWKDLFAKN